MGISRILGTSGSFLTSFYIWSAAIYDEEGQHMNPNYEGRPLGLWSNPISGQIENKMLKPFRGSMDPKSGSWAPAASPTGEEEPKTPVPAAPGASRLQDAAALVPAAAAVLDEEMAAGMLAAYDARIPGTKSSKVQGGSGSAGTDEWLRDLHDLVDALGSVLPRVQSYVANALDKSATLGRGLEYESVPVLCPHTPVRAGDRTRISIKLNNDNATPAQVKVLCTDFFSTSGARIPQRQVTLTPSQLQLGPDAHAEVTLEVAVPRDSRPGAYSGLLLTSGLSYLRAVIAIEVI
jgi:hypothetical protein